LVWIQYHLFLQCCVPAILTRWLFCAVPPIPFHSYSHPSLPPAYPVSPATAPTLPPNSTPSPSHFHFRYHSHALTSAPPTPTAHSQASSARPVCVHAVIHAVRTQTARRIRLVFVLSRYSFTADSHTHIRTYSSTVCIAKRPCLAHTVLCSVR
jgi:hypothetical protein